MRIRLSLIALTLIMGIISSCDNNKTVTKTEEEKQLEKLAKVWVPGSTTSSTFVTVAGNDVTADWANFVLTLGNKTYASTSANSPEIWPASGTWEFATNNVNKLIRDDGVEISITVTETSLIMQFDYSSTGGRLSGIEGAWIFNMIPQ